MSTGSAEHRPGHVFISYVREDRDAVNALQRHLSAAGVAVWRDTESLWPGQDWRAEIRRSIQSGSFAFLACFSDASEARETSYQNEELLLAVEQQRLRPVGRPWLIPVRLNECAIPDHDLGAGRTLNSINRIDLFGEDYDLNVTRLVTAVLRIVGETTERRTSTAQTVESVARQVKNLIRDGDAIALEEYAMGHASAIREALVDQERFPLQMQGDDLRQVVDRTHLVMEVLRPLADALAVACAWGRSQDQLSAWTRAIEAVINAPFGQSGSTRLVELQHLPEAVLLYAGAIAAVHRRNWEAFRAVAIDARARRPDGAAPLAGVVRPWRVFQNSEPAANVLAHIAAGEVIDDVDQALADFATGRRGKRYTPVSDFLHDALRSALTPVILDDHDYTESFDLAEVMLAAIAMDLDRQWQQSKSGPYIGNPTLGSTTWRHRHVSETPEVFLQQQLERDGDAWPPLGAGLFNGSADRAAEALAAVARIYTDFRARRF